MEREGDDDGNGSKLDSADGSNSPNPPQSAELSSPPKEADKAPKTDSHDSRDLQQRDSGISPKDPSSSPPPSDAARRVKIYKLTTQDWVDHGTGFCTGIYDSDHDEAMLVVTNEDNQDQVLLNHHISPADIYSRQQDTLIVWTESDGTDCALSFQEADGCLEMWDFISQVQRHVQKADDYPYIIDSPVQRRQKSSQKLNLPPERPDLGNLEDVCFCIKECLTRTITNMHQKERFITWLINNNYIAQLISVFNQAEDLEALSELHVLCTIFHQLLSANDSVVFEYVLSDDIFLGMCGVLEYDPEYPTLKASYRLDLTTTSRYKEVVQINDLGLKSKIHQTYRLLYLKDVILARTLDDSTFTLLNSFVYYNQIDIIKHIQNDKDFLDRLFGIFSDSSSDTVDPPPTLRQDAVLFLRDLCTMGKNVQIQTRQELYRALVNRNLLNVCKWSIKRSEPILHNTGSEILMIVIDNEPNTVRLYILNEANSTKEKSKENYTLMQEMCFSLDSSRDLGYRNQIAEAIRLLLEPPLSASEAAWTVAKPKADPTSDEFLSYFYDTCINGLFKPLLDIPDISLHEAPPQLDFDKATLALALCDLLSFFVLNHHFRAQYFILQTPISAKIVQLLRVKQKYLRLAALRYLRACVSLNNEFIVRYIDKQDIFKPMLDVALREGRKDNLISASILDLFETIRRINNRTMINSLVGNHEDDVKQLIKYPLLSELFTKLYYRWEQLNESAQPEASTSTVIDNSGGFIRERKSSDATAEDDYFNKDDGEDEARNYINDDPGGGGLGPGSGSHKVTHQSLNNTPTATSTSLVDYMDEDEEENTRPLPETPKKEEEEEEKQEQGEKEKPAEDRLTQMEVKLSEKRQREDDEDDQVAQLMHSKKRLSPNVSEAQTNDDKCSTSSSNNSVSITSKAFKCLELKDYDILGSEDTLLFMTTNTECINAYSEIYKYPKRRHLNQNSHSENIDATTQSLPSKSQPSTSTHAATVSGISSPSNGTKLKDRVLSRLAWSKREDIPSLFDERASVKFALDRCYDWEESIAIYKDNRVEIYGDHSMPFRMSKEVKLSVDLQSNGTSVSLYSATDFCLCIRTSPPKHHLPRRYAGTNLIFLKFKTIKIAKTWLWTMWTIKNSNKLPKELDVKLPALGSHVRFPIDFTDHNDVNSHAIVARCRNILTRMDIRGVTPEKSTQTGFSLCWRRGKFGLEWLSNQATYEEILVGCCMLQTQVFPKLELRRRAFEKVGIKYDANTTLYPPQPVEGHLSRITLISQKRVKTYLSTHDSLIFVLKNTTASLKASHDDELDKMRCCRQIREAVGFIDMGHIVSIRRIFESPERKDEYPIYIDDKLHNGDKVWDKHEEGDEGSEEAFGKLSQNEKNELHTRRQFGLELVSGHFAKFEAPSVKLCLEWIVSLGELCSYWNKRTRTDANLLMEISNCGLAAPHAANAINQLVVPTNIPHNDDDGPAVEDPDAGAPLLSQLWNWSVLENIKPIVKFGKCFMRKSFRGSWSCNSEYILILTADGMLHRWQIAPLNPSKSKKANEILNRKKSSISLYHAFVLTSDDLILVNSSDEIQTPTKGLRMSSRRAAKAPDRLYDDGLIACESEPSDLAFMLWCRPKSKKAIDCLDKDADKFEVRTRSRLERDHWCWCLESIIDRISEENNDVFRNVSGIS
ncbi:hypothetical protein E3P86_01869 [Wallemia ichthyophaga]|uniref:Uncharacterized protein n=1 Tax=Wallemia ichthyophaga TaxID=245174 RepID=A0A4T0J5L7_WALIC|nr:hypothetical protein E3P86_01869 [Wallemia ichthyophaga]